jgi:uncharacterized protein (TIGR00369 family)
LASRPHLDRFSPAGEHIGRKVTSVDDATGATRLSFLAKPEFANRHGTVAGGFLAAMLDSTTAAAILAVLPDDLTVVTTDLRVSFVRPARTGPITGTGRITRRGEREAICEGELSDPEGNTVARAEATFRIVRRQG